MCTDSLGRQWQLGVRSFPGMLRVSHLLHLNVFCIIIASPYEKKKRKKGGGGVGGGWGGGNPIY